MELFNVYVAFLCSFNERGLVSEALVSIWICRRMYLGATWEDSDMSQVC